MKSLSIIEKIESAGLCGRGGAGFPVASKWLSVKFALNSTTGGYIIVNAAEGEPGIKKDAYLLEKDAKEVINGIYISYNFLGKSKIKKVYFYTSKKYSLLYRDSILKILKSEKKYSSLASKFEFFIKPTKPNYIAGEESSIMNIIEGKRAQPRNRPPYPSESGLFALPTLINNVETFHSVSLVSRNKYQGKRLYTIAGAVRNKGVFSLPSEISAEEVLKITNNYPSFDFFALLGGEVCGEILDKHQLLAPIEGSGFIMVFDKQKTDREKLLDYWLKFYESESCGLCTACREGSHRLREMTKQDKYDKHKFNDLLENLELASFCALGSSLPQTIKSYMENIYFKI